MSYKPIPTDTIGGDKKAIVDDIRLIDLVQQLLIQIRITNFHLASMTDNEYKEHDLDSN